MALRFRIAPALAAALAIAACTATPSPPRAPVAPLAGVDGGRAYQIGYADGCSSGLRAAAGESSGAVVPAAEDPGGGDRLYLSGWAAGHYACRRLAERPGWAI